MLTLDDVPAVRQVLSGWRDQGERIGLVPTMGNLHEGHLSLVKQAIELASQVVVSVFVNPMQFDRADDLAAYPRTLKQDAAKLAELNVDLLFAPSVNAVYPMGFEETTRVEVPGLSNTLCGASRPGHFRGVTTVVTKLFNIVQPDLAVFGEKDYQQLVIIRRLTADLHVPVEIIGCPIVREADGLAMSSRNSYLTEAQRARAPALHQTLQSMVESIKSGNRDYHALEREGIRRLNQNGFKPDYLSVRRQQDLAEAGAFDDKLVVLAAAWSGKARLIDNVPLSLKDQR